MGKNGMIKEKDFMPSELKAIEQHKYFMSKAQGKEVSIEEAMRDFIGNYEANWKKEKIRRDNLEQLNEINKHKYIRSQQEGRDIGELAAAEEWRQKYASIWREEQESLEKNEFLSAKVIVKNKNGLHVRPSSTLANLASKYDCDVYVHKEEMEHYNFTLNGKRYLNVKSILGLLMLAAAQNEQIEFIAAGKDAKDALAAIENLANKKFGMENE